MHGHVLEGSKGQRLWVTRTRTAVVSGFVRLRALGITLRRGSERGIFDRALHTRKEMEGREKRWRSWDTMSEGLSHLCTVVRNTCLLET